LSKLRSKPNFFTARPNRYFLIAFGIILLDQTVKFIIKLNMKLGQEIHLIGDFFKIHFIENEGAAFGLTIGNIVQSIGGIFMDDPSISPRTGKAILTLFSFFAVFFIVYILIKISHTKFPGQKEIEADLKTSTSGDPNPELLEGINKKLSVAVDEMSSHTSVKVRDIATLSKAVDSVAEGWKWLESAKNTWQKAKHPALPVFIAMILGGAVGNIIDRMFYGLWFAEMNNYEGGFLFGRVVDLFYIDIWDGFIPNWIPFIGGEYYAFWPIFNVADTGISIGIISIILFQRKFLSEPDLHGKKKKEISSEKVPERIAPPEVTDPAEVKISTENHG